MKREKFPTRTITIDSDLQRQTVLNLVPHLPQGVEVVIREKQPARKPDQNAEMWAGFLRDIAEQGYVNGRAYSADTWHEHFKREYLPEEFDAELCREGYRKWDYTPSGERVLVGSTTQLTVKGFAIYREQVIADGANLGVQFSAAPGQLRRVA
jgi:hypothetical protein